MKIKFNFPAIAFIALAFLITFLGEILFVGGAGIFKFSDGSSPTDATSKALSMFLGTLICVAGVILIIMSITTSIKRGMIEADQDDLYKQRVKEEMEITFQKFISENFKTID